MYRPIRNVTQQDIAVRHLRYRVNTWGKPGARPLFLLHGWMDTGMSFQALADAMRGDWYLIAPDWRGFGASEWEKNGYWFPDYLADLDTLVNHYSPSAPVSIAGHSMGGNICWLYAGVRPERVIHAISIDAFGLKNIVPEQAPARYREWLDQLLEPPRFAEYEDTEHLILQLKRLAPRISTDYAEFIAGQWAKPGIGTQLLLRADPHHKRVNPILYRRAEARNCWKNMTARACLILGEQSEFYKQYQQDDVREDCRSCFQSLTETVIHDTGHMLHWEKPEQLATEIEGFLLREE